MERGGREELRDEGGDGEEREGEVQEKRGGETRE